MSRRRDLEPLSRSLDAVRHELGLVEAGLFEQISEIWRQVVPDSLSAATSIDGLRDGRLVVSTTDPGVASQLRFTELAVLKAVATQLGDGVVEEVVVKVVRPDRGAGS